MAQSSTYSFTNVEGIFTGLGSGGSDLSFSITEGGIAEEGMTISAFEDKNVMKTGADGSVQHSLIEADSGQLKIRVMRNNIVHNRLLEAFNVQKIDSTLWGKNTISIIDTASNESYTLLNCAFKKLPENNYAKEAQVIEWDLDVGQIIVNAGLNVSP